MAQNQADTRANAGGAAILAGRETIEAEAEALHVLARALDGPLGAAFAQAVETMAATKGRVIVTGMGKSGHIARKIAATLASTGRPAHFVHPGEASHGDLGMITADDCVVALSRSGESAELIDLFHHCRRLKIPVIGMTFRAESTLGEASDILLLMPDRGEASEDAPAPTTSTTMSLALGDALAIALLRKAGFTAQHFRAIHPGGKLGSMLKHVRDVMRTGDEVPLIAPDKPVAEMLTAMSEGKLGAVGLVEGGKLIGIVTDGDLRRRMTAKSFDDVARSLMTANPKTISPEASLADAITLLNDMKITTVFAVQDGKPVGVIHMHDLLNAGVR